MHRRNSEAGRLAFRSGAVTHTELISDNDEILHVDVNHDDILVVSAENKEVRWYRVKFSEMEFSDLLNCSDVVRSCII